MQKKKAKVTQDSNLGEVIQRCPEAGRIMTQHGLFCVGCLASAFETIEEGARAHGLSEEELREMINKINEVIKGENGNA